MVDPSAITDFDNYYQPLLIIDGIDHSIVGREEWLAPLHQKRSDSEERGQATLPYL
jgi:hypothetical protein